MPCASIRAWPLPQPQSGTDYTPKPKCLTLVHFATQPFRSVILSAAKNLTARPFAEFILSVAEGFRVTILVYQSLEVRFGRPHAGAPRAVCDGVRPAPCGAPLAVRRVFTA